MGFKFSVIIKSTKKKRFVVENEILKKEKSDVSNLVIYREMAAAAVYHFLRMHEAATAGNQRN